MKFHSGNLLCFDRLIMTDFEERFRDEVTIYLEIILQRLERKFS